MAAEEREVAATADIDKFWETAAGLLRDERMAQGWTQPELATRAAVSRGLVANYELGARRQPALYEWRKLVAALGYTWDQFERQVEQRAGVSLTAGVTRPSDGTPSAIDATRLRRRLRDMEEVDARLEARIAAIERSLGMPSAPVATDAPRTSAEDWMPVAAPVAETWRGGRG